MNTIRKRRAEVGITQVELAKAVGVTQGAVAQWEAHITSPNIRFLPKLAEILDCTTDELLGISKKTLDGSEKVV